MKKSLMLLAAAILAVVMTGCVGISSFQGAPNTLLGGVFSNVSGNSLIQQPTTDDFIVVKHNVTGIAKVQCYFGIVTLGDTSFSTLKASALKDAPGADDIIDVKIDYSSQCVIGISETTVKMTGTAIKYK